MSHLRLVANDDGERAERREDDRVVQLRRLVVLRPVEPPDDEQPDFDPAA